MTTSLYHSLKSLARGVIFCAWAISGRIPERASRWAPVPRCPPQVPHHHLAGRPLVGPDDDRPRCSPRRGELQLLADGGGPEAVFDGDAPVAQLVRQFQQRRYVVAAHRYQKGVELRRRLVGRAALLQEFSEDDISHAEAQGGEIDAEIGRAHV